MFAPWVIIASTVPISLNLVMQEAMDPPQVIIVIWESLGTLRVSNL